jgi:5'-nucleotidase
MKLLLTNDDSVHAVGINTLYRGLVQKFGVESIFVVAPEREQSACSHAITLHKALRVHEVGKNRFSVSGTPADCVSLGLASLLKEVAPIDMVISGINHGPNLGTDIANSGTVSGAIQATLMHHPALAVSYAGKVRAGEEENLTLTIRAVCEWIEKIVEKKLPPYTLININVPASLNGKISPTDKLPYQISSMGIRSYEQHFDQRQDPCG